MLEIRNPSFPAISYLAYVALGRLSIANALSIIERVSQPDSDEVQPAVDFVGPCHFIQKECEHLTAQQDGFYVSRSVLRGHNCDGRGAGPIVQAELGNSCNADPALCSSADAILSPRRCSGLIETKSCSSRAGVAARLQPDLGSSIPGERPSRTWSLSGFERLAGLFSISTVTVSAAMC